ncbi:uncharacterized protein BYT42DRAFT_579228 [Radiomyces spectabilis]|uniref:uncharacterized protein n=1 Tax=Radiomyces spectabilis TaxID=64574 RepID=UPI00221FD308|nr:uncharacterized protein BYT42DRAFT_579228 [Radiomyces spectabilis]KAI8373104.1 hypothetical protein BYT42DRAFT_579228 [Radiomyces spectabilis]
MAPYQYPKKASFNKEILDTFCFHWPAAHKYVLVRVLDDSIAMAPVRSRMAFLFFHNAPPPRRPSVATSSSSPRFGPSRVHSVFRAWKHTLIFADTEDSDDDEEPSDKDTLTRQRSTSPSNAMSPGPAISLNDIITDNPTLCDNWIHAQCRVDQTTPDTAIRLYTKHTTVMLRARCLAEKVAFLNLVRLTDQRRPSSDAGARSVSSDTQTIMSDSLIEDSVMQNEHQFQKVDMLARKLEKARDDIQLYFEELQRLDHGCATLSHSLDKSAVGDIRRVLKDVREQMASSMEYSQSHQRHMNDLEKKAMSNSGILKTVDLRLEDLQNTMRQHAWYPWLYTGLISISIVILSFLVYWLLR